MFTSKSIDAEHKDLIQDVAYDFHGKRMATCSCDQHVKVCANAVSCQICRLNFPLCDVGMAENDVRSKEKT